MKFIHITDPHLVPSPEKLFALDPRERLAQAVAEINSRQADAEFLVMTGDLADRGEPGAYRDLKAILDRLTMPYHLLLGNHDSRAAYYAAFPDAPKDANGFCQFVVEGPRADCILLDSLVEGVHGGQLCQQRLTWLADTLAARRNKDVLLFLHHAPLGIGIPYMDGIGLDNPDALHSLIQDHGRVRHLFFGHVHRPLSGSWRGLPFSTVYGTNHQVALQFHLQDQLPGRSELPQYAVVLVTQDSLLVHYHSYLDTAGPPYDLDSSVAGKAENARDLPPFAGDLRSPLPGAPGRGR